MTTTATMTTTRLLSPSDDAHLIPYLAALHAMCIHQDGMVATFLPPLDSGRLLGFWRETLAAATAGTRLVAVQLDEPATGANGGLRAVAVLRLPSADTAAHQGRLETLMVSPKARRRGAATALVRLLEAEAAGKGRRLILLNTAAGGPAETVCAKLGYTEYGRVPRCSISPSGAMVDDVFFYKEIA
ncbi:putative acetyltransferase [Rosellinia necatrix]|uniref:Putative acetyltransferase n=1 Tax=Rosellinia necatrix TaxID=77044 RepID=A0A1S7UI74_ROSNE|nr:putative acetyltransferase [Rosellinia necatrix]